MSATDRDMLKLPKKKFKMWNWVWVILMVLGLVLSVNNTQTSLPEFFANFDQFAEIFVQMAQPDCHMPALPFLTWWKRSRWPSSVRLSGPSWPSFTHF